jgi:hypothetical protein
MKNRIISLFIFAIILIAPLTKAQVFNYAEALQKSLYFYDAEKSGPGITGGLLPWRGNSEVSDMQVPLNTTMTDMSQAFINANKAVLDPDNNGMVDVSGGYHDAGDHVKFGLPQSYSSSTLEWAYYEFKDAFVNIGEQAHIRNLLKWFSDYYLRCTFMNPSGQVVAFCYQVGEGNSDHTLWAPPEIIDRTVITRPAYFGTSEKPASDQAAGAAASLALSYLNNKSDSLTYANKCLTYAKALYNFAVQYRGMGYSGGFYNSSFDEDELSWAAVWLYLATNDSKYIDDIIKKDANGLYTGWLAKIIHSASDNWQNIWVHSWDTKWGGVFAKLAPITNDQFYWYIFRWNLEYWSGVPHANTNDGTFLAKTPAGFSFLNSWGSARYNAAAQFQAVVYKKYASNSDFDNWTVSQMKYIMGNNPLSRSYIVGYGSNYAKHPHHRAAHGSSTNSMFDPVNHKHILYGALVGGPGASDEHKDSTNDFVYNEVAIDYNAGLVGALAGIYKYFGQGQMPIANFVPTDPPLVEYGIETKIEQENTERSQITLKVNNVPAYPPRLDVTPMARYFFNISEMIQYGQSIADLSTAIYYDESSVLGSPVKVTGPLAWDAANGIYYMEFLWPKGIYGKRELQFALIANQDPILHKAHWDPTNDYSHQGLTTAYTSSPYITLYIGGNLVLGTEPLKGTPVAVTGVTIAPTTVSINVGLISQLTATILPANATNKSVSWTSSNTSIASVSSTGLVTAIAKGTATITVTTADGAKTAACSVTVTDSGSGNSCSFGTPLLTALPTIANKTYNYVYVLGTGGPALSNIRNFTINWDLANHGLYQLSVNTTNGSPNWYVDLRTGATQTFASPLPSITLSGTGFAGLDGSYYAAIDNGNFVLVSKTGGFTIYFSSSATAPSCTKSAEIALSGIQAGESSIVMFPNPFMESLNLQIINPDEVTAIYVADELGRVLVKLAKASITNNIKIGRGLKAGTYILHVETLNGSKSYLINKQ